MATSVVDIPLNRGIRQDVDPLQAPPGALTQALGVEFDVQSPRLKRVDGFTGLTMTNTLKNRVLTGVVRRTAETPDGKQLLFTDEGIWTRYGGQTVEPGPIQNNGVRAQLKSKTVLSQLGDTSVSVGLDSLYLNGYIMLAGQRNSNPFIEIYDATTRVQLIAASATVASFSTLSPNPVRLVKASSTAALMLVATTAGNLVGYKIDLGASPVTISAGTNVVTNLLTNGPIFDCDYFASAGAAVVSYLQTTAGTVTTVLVNSSKTVTATVNTATGTTIVTPVIAGQITSGAISVSGNNGTLATVNVFDVTNKKLLSYLYTNALGLFASNGTTISPAPTNVISMTSRQYSGGSGTNFTAVVFSDRAGAQTASTGVWLATVDLGGNSSFEYRYNGYSVASKLWVDGGGALYAVLEMATFPAPSQGHYLLADFGANPSMPVPLFHVSYGRAPTYDTRPPVVGFSGNGDTAYVVLPEGVAGLPNGTGQTQATLLTVQARGTGRYLSANAGGLTVIAGATPLLFDGLRAVEMGFYYPPLVDSSCFVGAAAGGSMVAGTYTYKLQWQWTDAQGNRHVSSPSAAQSVTFGAGTTNQTTITITSLSATRKQMATLFGSYSNRSDTTSPVKLAIYRSAVGAPGLYYQVAIIDNNPAVATISYVDTWADAQIISHETLDDSSLNAVSTCPPPTSQVFVMGDRIFGVDTEQPERFWASLTFSTGAAPNYSPALGQFVPGAGTIQGLAGQDGKLYAFTSEGVWLAYYGEGPDNTGANGSFPSPQMLTTDTPCDEPRSVLAAQDGIYFSGVDRGGRTVYLLRRGDSAPIPIGRYVSQELLAYPVLRGAVVRNDKQRIEFLVSDVDSGPTQNEILYYHTDLLDEQQRGQWTSRRFKGGGFGLETIGTWGNATVLGGVASDAYLQTTAQQTDDAGTTFQPYVETCDIRPFGLLGTGRVHSATFMGYATAVSNFYFSASTDSGQSYPSPQTYTATATGPIYYRLEPSVQDLTTGTIRFLIRDLGPGLYYSGISLETEPRRGNIRLPAGQVL